MKLEITKVCADSLRAFTQNNYGVQLKSSHAHELVAAFFGYASRAALIADKKFPIDKLTDSEIIVLTPLIPLVDQRLKSLENLPLELPPSDILAKSVFAPIVADEQFAGKIWSSLHDVAMALVEERAQEFKMFGNNIGEMEWISDVDIKTTESHAMMTIIFDYPTNTTKPLRYSKVDIALPRIAGSIGYTKFEVKPTFYHGHMTDPDFRLKHGIN
jgi:hypothetical protein